MVSKFSQKKEKGFGDVIRIRGARVHPVPSPKRRATGQVILASNVIRVRGARVHNLKNINVDIPKNKLVVITGLSGSGKSSLAFDTIYAEAERRYVESLSAYARQFLGVSDKPDVDSIEGLSPAIAIDQRSVPRNPRSTVGTITEIYDYLRILFARIGKPHCPQCGKPIGRQTIGQIVDHILKYKKGVEVQVLAPLVRGKKGEHRGILEEVFRAGFIRVRIDGVVHRLEDALELALDKKRKHSIEVVVDRVEIGRGLERSRLSDSVETALKIGKGIVLIGIAPVNSNEEWHDEIFSEHFACSECSINLPEIEPRTFSFNSPYGACPACTGLGSTLEVDESLVFPNPKLTLAEGAIAPWSHASHRVGRQSWYWWMLEDISSRYKFSLNKSVTELAPAVRKLILYGEPVAVSEDEDRSGRFEGVVPNLKRRWKETDSEWTRAEIEKYMTVRVCPACNGKRLKKEALGVAIAGKNIAEIADLTVRDAMEFFDKILPKELSATSAKIAAPLGREIVKRLSFLMNVGLHYLTLSRESTTLAGGEAQRIRLATQIGSRLTGVIYVLDEPSIGLHARDHHMLIETIKELRDLGNTVIVVEHDRETMREADWIIDLGPGAGKHGGEVIFSGDAKALWRAQTLTADYLSGRKEVRIKRHEPRSGNGKFLEIRGAAEHNLKNINVRIPLGVFVAVTGPSGSGKSTLINDILAKAMLAKLYKAHVIPGAHKDIKGIENFDKVVVVDQSPIGRTPRSNPVTYTGAFGLMRDVFAKTNEARVRGYAPGRFSFNVKGGRCEICEGQGVKKIEMYFLPDVYVECEECRGTRYNKEALDVEYNGKNIAQILNMTVEEALKFFEKIPQIKQKLQTLSEVGLSYVKLGQSATTLSGGEAQRIKLSAELSRRDTGHTLYILDEPTTGLHFDDIRKLLNVLHSLVDKGNTVLIIEHNLDVIRNSDWIIDLGPEGGAGGGDIVAEGLVKDIIAEKKSHTGVWLKKTIKYG